MACLYNFARRPAHRPTGRVALVLTVIGLLLAALTSAADSPRADRPLVFEDLIEVSEVFLDVLVSDAEGRTVPGLERGDFLVHEDGVEVPITGVEYQATRYGAATSEEEIPTSRYFVLFLHDQTRFGYFGGELLRQQSRLGQDLEQWVRGGMLPSDWVAVVSYATRLHLHQDFTQNREDLLAAISEAVAGRAPGGFAGPGRGEGGMRRGDGPLGVLARMPDPAVRADRVDDVYDALRTVAEATGVLVGRKNLLLFTAGVGRRVGRGGATVIDPHELPALEATLNDHNVAVYPIDLTPPARMHLFTDALTDLAERTGGAYHADFVGFTTPLEAISAESAGYYLLSYQAAHTAGEVGYQRVEVSTRRGDLTVRARRGYLYGR